MSLDRETRSGLREAREDSLRQVEHAVGWLRDNEAATRSTRWQMGAWLGSLGMGLSAFMFFARNLHFEYHSFQDIVATPAFLRYPEQKDWWLYVLAVTVVPLGTIAGYRVWSYLCAWLQRIRGISEPPDVALVALTYLLWWIDPLTFLIAHRFAILTALDVGAIFVISNFVLVGHAWLQAGSVSRPLQSPPPLSLLGGVTALGAIVGVSFLVSPFVNWSLGSPVWTVLGAGLITAAMWMGSSLFWAKRTNRSWDVLASRLAICLLPLSVLPLQDVSWLEGYQGGIRVFASTSWWAPILLIGLATLGSILMIVAQMRRGADNVEPSPSEHFWRWFFRLTVPILLYALAYDPNIHYPLDLFHEGERVAPAQALLSGQVPYKDVVFVHGFLRDPGVALVAFRLFGPTIAGLRTLEQFLYPLSLVSSYYLAFLCVGGPWALLYALLGLTGFFPVFYDWRIIPAVITLICLVLYLRRGSHFWVVVASFFTFFALATSFDVGLVTLCASGVFISLRFLSHWPKRISVSILYSIPLLCCFLLVMLYFLSVNALGPFLNWHWQLLQVYRDWNGMPYPISLDGLVQIRDSLLSPLASVLGILALWVGISRKRWGWPHWLILLLLVSNLTLFNRGVVSGSPGISALDAGSHFAPLLLLILFLHYSNERGQNGARSTVAVALSIFLLLPLPQGPTQASDLSVFGIVNQLPTKNRITIPSSWVKSSVERVGPLYIPAEQERSVEQVVEFLEKGQTFWDFSDHGAFFFLAKRTSPTRYYTTHHVITGQDQEQVIRDLTRNPPEYVLYRSNTEWDAIAGVDRSLRSFLVADFLLRNYHPTEPVGGLAVLERGAPESFPAGTPFRVDLGSVPFVWGQDREGLLKLPDSVRVAQWSFSLANGLMGWEAPNDVPLLQLFPEGLRVRTGGNDPQVQNLNVTIDPRSVTYLVLNMAVTTPEQEERANQAKPGDQEIRVQFFWRMGTESFTEERSVFFNAVADGQTHSYLVRLSSFPSWAWSGPITGIRLDPGDTANTLAMIHSIELIGAKELQVRKNE